MKLLVVCFFLVCLPAAFCSITETIDNFMHGFEDDCAEESGVNHDNIENARENGMLPDNDQMKQFARCMLRKLNVMNNEGYVNQNIYSYTIVYDTPNLYDDVANKCKIIRTNSFGETARKIMNCFLNDGQIVMAFTPNPKANLPDKK